MDCLDACRALSAATDGELPPGRKGRLEEHLLECPACADVARGLEALREAFASLPRPRAPRDTAERVLERIRITRERLRSAGPFLKVVAAAAAVLLLVTTAANLLTAPPPTPPPPPLDLTADIAIDRMMGEIVLDFAPEVGNEEVNR